MLGQALDICFTAIDACAGWFLETFEKLGVLGFWFTAVLIYSIYRFLLRPLFGTLDRGSDTVKNKYKYN